MSDGQNRGYSTGTAFYWCVNCGDAGYYGYRRVTNFSCMECHYDRVTPYELEEILQDEHLKFQFKKVLDANPLIIRS